MDKECWSCGNRIIGLGCCRSEPIQRVTDHYTCSHWLPKNAPNTINAREDAYDNRLKGA